MLALADGDYISQKDNWDRMEKYAQLCYSPTPSLSTTDKCDWVNDRVGYHKDDLFNQIDDFSG